MSYYFSNTLKVSFEDAVIKITEGLKKEAFEILTEIDVQDALKKKLNIDFKKYKILGVCNAVFAHEALQIEDKIGTLFPCNVIVQELPEGRIEVAAIDPVASMQAVENEKLKGVAKQVQGRLKRVIQNL